MKKLLIIALIATLGMFLSGCPELVGTPLLIHQEADGFASTDENIGHTSFDLSENDDFAEHQDEITSVEYVAVSAWIVNNSGHPISGQLWSSIDPWTDPDDVREGGDSLYTTPEIADGDTVTISFTIDFSQPPVPSEFEYELLGGYASIYGLGDQDDFNIQYDVSIHVLFYYNPNESEE